MSFNPFTAKALIHSLGETRTALIGLYYVDDKYGIIESWNEEEKYEVYNEPSADV